MTIIGIVYRRVHGLGDVVFWLSVPEPRVALASRSASGRLVELVDNTYDGRRVTAERTQFTTRPSTVTR